jgi:hypothetical protein
MGSLQPVLRHSESRSSRDLTFGFTAGKRCPADTAKAGLA